MKKSLALLGIPFAAAFLGSVRPASAAEPCKPDPDTMRTIYKQNIIERALNGKPYYMVLSNTLNRIETLYRQSLVAICGPDAKAEQTDIAKAQKDFFIFVLSQAGVEGGNEYLQFKADRILQDMKSREPVGQYVPAGVKGTLGCVELMPDLTLPSGKFFEGLARPDLDDPRKPIAFDNMYMSKSQLGEFFAARSDAVCAGADTEGQKNATAISLLLKAGMKKTENAGITLNKAKEFIRQGILNPMLLRAYYKMMKHNGYKGDQDWDTIFSIKTYLDDKKPALLSEPEIVAINQKLFEARYNIFGTQQEFLDTAERLEKRPDIGRLSELVAAIRESVALANAPEPGFRPVTNESVALVP